MWRLIDPFMEFGTGGLGVKAGDAVERAELRRPSGERWVATTEILRLMYSDMPLPATWLGGLKCDFLTGEAVAGGLLDVVRAMLDCSEYEADLSTAGRRACGLGSVTRRFGGRCWFACASW